MSDRIEVNLALNTSGVAQGADDAKQHLADLQDAVGDLDDGARGAERTENAIDDLGRAAVLAADDVDQLGDATGDAARKGARDADRLGDSLRDIGDDADRAADDIDEIGDATTDAAREGERSLDRFEDAMRKVQREADDTGKSLDDIGDGGSSNFRRLGDAGSEVGDELRQNLGETFSSFRGDLEDLPQIAQDTLGGLAGSGALGGIPGLAATAAGAAGLGLIIGGFEKINEANEESQERIADWADAFIEAGNTVLGAAELVGGVQAIATDPERFKEAETNAENWGITVSDAMRVMAGDTTALIGTQRALDEKFGVTQERADELGISLDLLKQNNLAAHDAYRDGSAALEQQSREMESGAERARAMSDSLIGIINDAEGVAYAVDEVGNVVATLPDGQEIFISAETGVATSNIDGVQGDLEDLPDDTTVTVSADTGLAINGLRATDRKADQTGRKRPRVRASADTAAANRDLDNLNGRRLGNKTIVIDVDSSRYDRWAPPLKVGYVETRPANPFERKLI